MATAKFQAGDRVVGTGLGDNLKPGRVDRVRGRGDVSCVVVWDDAPGVSCVVRCNDMRLETAEDVAKRLKDNALKAWLDKRPTFEHLRCSNYYTYGSRTSVSCVEIMCRLTTPADMRAAATELVLAAEWFERKPS